jgi:hypothetical protein
MPYSGNIGPPNDIHNCASVAVEHVTAPSHVAIWTHQHKLAPVECSYLSVDDFRYGHRNVAVLCGAPERPRVVRTGTEVEQCVCPAEQVEGGAPIVQKGMRARWPGRAVGT